MSMDPITERFLIACAQGDSEVLTQAMEQGADAGSLTEQGDNGLHLACHFGHVELIGPLVRHGVSTNTQNTEGRTPANICASEGRGDCFAALMEATEGKADITTPDKAGRNVRETAVFQLAQSQQHAQAG